MQIYFKIHVFKNKAKQAKKKLHVFFLLLFLFISLLVKITLVSEKPDSTKFWLAPAEVKPMEGNHGQRLYKQAYLPNQEKYWEILRKQKHKRASGKAGLYLAKTLYYFSTLNLTLELRE